MLPVALHLIPAPVDVVSALAPANERFARNFDVNRAFSAGAWHPLSVAPELTARFLLFLTVGAVWVSGLRRTVHAGLSLSTLAGAIICLGVVVGVLALVQKATFNEKIYWFWESPFRVAANYYGPFVNRNHFAGWMLLAVALGAGHFMGLAAVAGRNLKPGWRERLLWVASPQASHVLLTGAALAVMTVSLIWSLSRSGIAATIVALFILAAVGIWRGRTRFTAAAAAFVMVVLVAGAAWKGLDVVAASYRNTSTLEWRFALWRDSLAPLRDFFLSGSGLNTYGTVMLLYPQTDQAVHAQQAHNDYLQLAIEGGLVVIVPWVIAFGLLGRHVLHRLAQPQDEHTWWVRLGAAAGICGIAVQEISEFSLQIPGVALLFATLLAIALHEPSPVRAGSRRRSAAAVYA